MPPSETDENGALESLRNKLYAREAPAAFPAPALARTPAPAPVTSTWDAPQPAKKRGLPISVLFLIAAAAFFALALAAAAYFLVFGARAISTDHIAITVDAPSSVGSGDRATLLIHVKNQNPTAITHTRLVVDTPEGGCVPDNASSSARFDDTIGDIPAGGTKDVSVPATIFGSLGDTITVPLKLEYRTEGSNAVFVKDASYSAVIASSPVAVSVSAPAQASSNQPLTVTVSVRSSARETLPDVMVSGTYPFGFIASKSASSTGALVDLGALSPGAEKSFTVSGTLTGEAAEERVFRFSAGTACASAPGSLSLVYGSGQSTVSVAKPFLSTRLVIEDDATANPVIRSGRPTQAVVSWQNTLAAPLLDAEVSVALSGAALDPSSIIASGGFYRSGDATILYGRDTNPALALLAPGESGSGSFVFSTKSGAALTTLRNPTITATVSVSGRKSGDANTRTVASTVTRVIQVGTDLGFTAKSVRTSGPFANTGPVPPRADTETTYTILLAFTNTVNSVGGATVSATLPAYVRYVGASGQSEGLSYSAATRTVTWNAGDVPAGTSASAPLQAAFQVAFLPSTSQRGTSPILMNAASYSGTDRFTKKVLSGTAPAVTIQAVSDPSYQPSWGEVQK